MSLKCNFISIFRTIFCFYIYVSFTIDTFGFYANNLTFISTNYLNIWHHRFFPFWCRNITICITNSMWIHIYICIETTNQLIIQPNSFYSCIITNRLNKFHSIGLSILLIWCSNYYSMSFSFLTICHNHSLTYLW